jgi:hypothetical protein
MKAPVIAALFVSLAPSIGAAAQGIPKPSAGVRKLGYYVGTWEGHGETKAGPFGRAGKLSSRMTCKWFAGGFQVLCNGEEQGPTGTRSFLNILSYDESAKAYTEYSISSRGEAEFDQNGRLDGDKLTFAVKQDVAGKPAHFRYTEVHVSPVLMTYEAEVAIGGAPSKVLARGTIKKLR